MDKAAFIKLAPDYYATAIIAFLDRYGRPASGEEISNSYSISDEDNGGEKWSYLARRDVFDAALKELEEWGFINIVRDHFGPPIVSPANDLYNRLLGLSKDESFPYYKYKLTADGNGWLRGALQSLDRAYDNLKIRPIDFVEPLDEWEPLPLERNDPLVEKTIGAVDDTIEKVRSDNGYASNFPEERQHVLDGLSAFSRRLKEAASISLGYVRRYAADPLRTLLSRFKDNAIGIAASIAKEALREWLKQKGISFLDDLF